jgi:hypothetical protein
MQHSLIWLARARAQAMDTDNGAAAAEAELNERERAELGATTLGNSPDGPAAALAAADRDRCVHSAVPCFPRCPHACLCCSPPS